MHLYSGYSAILIAPYQKSLETFLNQQCDNIHILLYLLIQMELDIAFLANVTGDFSVSQRFNKASQARKKAIESVFWNAEKEQWLDYWLSNSKCKVLSTSFDISCYQMLCDSHRHFSNLFYFHTRVFKNGKLGTRMRRHLLRTSFLYGLSHSTQVCVNFEAWTSC